MGAETTILRVTTTAPIACAIVYGETPAVEAIDQAIEAAKRDPRPALIMVRNVIGYLDEHKANAPPASGGA